MNERKQETRMLSNKKIYVILGFQRKRVIFWRQRVLGSISCKFLTEAYVLYGNCKITFTLHILMYIIPLVLIFCNMRNSSDLTCDILHHSSFIFVQRRYKFTSIFCNMWSLTKWQKVLRSFSATDHLYRML